MAEIINLRQARKARARAEGESQAAANRLKHGRTKAEKRHSAMTRQREDSILDGARLEPGDE